MSIFRTDSKNNNGRIARVEEEMRGLSSQYGTTSQRPVYGKSPVSIPYFDRELNLPIWWNGTVWLKADGSNA